MRRLPAILSLVAILAAWAAAVPIPGAPPASPPCRGDRSGAVETASAPAAADFTVLSRDAVAALPDTNFLH